MQTKIPTCIAAKDKPNILTIMPCLSSQDGLVEYYFCMDDVLNLLEFSDVRKAQYVADNRAKFYSLDNLHLHHSKAIRRLNNTINLFNLRGDSLCKTYQRDLNGSALYENHLRKDCDRLLTRFEIVQLLDWMRSKQWYYRWCRWTNNIEESSDDRDHMLSNHTLYFINELELSYLIFANGSFRETDKTEAVERAAQSVQDVCKWIILELLSTLRKLARLNREHVKSIKIMRFNERELHYIEEGFAKSMALLLEQRAYINRFIK